MRQLYSSRSNRIICRRVFKKETRAYHPAFTYGDQRSAHRNARCRAFYMGKFRIDHSFGIHPAKKDNRRPHNFAILYFSILFFIITNFGIWLLGWYPHTTSGLIQCYAMALPFLRDFALSTLVYAAAFFGSYELIASAVRDRKSAKVFLNKI